ncbi:hypothetical protein Afe04nite_49050 [Asanoa ferruginea]|nr:hypothetical protein Afe04nite_49050 [Asanoa ferruginea]
MTGPTRRYALIVLALAVTSSLPILAAIGPGAGSVGSALAVDEPLDTTPFIAPPSPGPVVVIPIRPSLAEPPPPPLATLSAPAETSPRRPQRRAVTKPHRTKPHRHVAAHGAPERVHSRPRARVRQPDARVEPAQPAPARRKTRVVHRRKLWHRPPVTLPHPCRHRPRGGF